MNTKPTGPRGPSQPLSSNSHTQPHKSNGAAFGRTASQVEGKKYIKYWQKLSEIPIIGLFVRLIARFFPSILNRTAQPIPENQTPAPTVRPTTDRNQVLPSSPRLRGHQDPQPRQKASGEPRPPVLTKPVQQKLDIPPGQATRTPGFRNYGARTCFANSSLKQLIISMDAADISHLRSQAEALRKTHPGAYQHEIETSKGQSTEPRDGGRRAEVIQKFADLAEATLRGRAGQNPGNIEEKQYALHQACYDLGQSEDIASRRFKTMYPQGGNNDFSGAQQDAHEYLVELLTIIDEDHRLSSPLHQGYTVTAVDGSGLSRTRAGHASSCIQVPIDGSSLEDLFKPTVETMDGDNKPEFSDGMKHKAQKSDQFAHPNPGEIKRLNLQVKAFDIDLRTGSPVKKTNEARALVLDHPFQELNIELLNTTTGKPEPVHLKIKSIVAHLGDGPSVGHYIALERQGGKWIVYDDSRTYAVNNIQQVFRDKNMIPYLISYQAD